MGLSRRAYAALRGVQMRAVRKAIATERVTLEVDRTIDASEADAMWDAATDLLLSPTFSSWVQKQLPASYWEWCRKSNSGFAKPPLDRTCWVGLHWHG